MKEETIEIDKQHRLLIQKQFRRSQWGYFVVMQQKIFLIGWVTLRLINEGWDAVYGYHSLEIAKERAEQVKSNYLEG